MKLRYCCFCALQVLFTTVLVSQHVGIGTLYPQRLLEVEGDPSRYIRVHTTSPFSGEAGVELTRGFAFSGSRDWKLANQGGAFKLLGSSDNFATEHEIFRISTIGEMGIGTTAPTAKLHIANGEEAGNATDGYLLLGNKQALNLSIDNNEINARNNGNGSALYLQNAGGSLYLQHGGGTAYMATGDGSVGVNTQVHLGKFNVRDAGMQLRLRNYDGGDENTWYIGASSDTWTAGDDQLLFSPDGTSAGAALRLMNTSDNNGDIAPMMIHSSPSQVLLLDGNEIDSKYGPLYINHNSDHNTYLNASGGKVGIATTNPQARLHVKAPNAGPHAIEFKRSSALPWSMLTFPLTDNLGFFQNGSLKASADGNSGSWIAISDARLKENVQSMNGVLDKLQELEMYAYTFKHDSSGTHNLGLIAQEVKEVFPELVAERGDRHIMSYAQLVVVALRALQEQSNQIDQLSKKLQVLQTQKASQAQATTSVAPTASKQ